MEAYSSVVERTAHDGSVVGSNPTRLILKIITMKSKLRVNKYKINLIKKLLEKETFFLFQTTNLSNNSFKELKSIFIKKNLNSFKISTKLVQILIKNSKLKNILNLVEGPILFSCYNKPALNYDIESLLKIHENLVFLGLKDKKRVHSVSQANHKGLNLNSNQSKVNYILTMKKSSKKLCLVLEKKNNT